MSLPHFCWLLFLLFLFLLFLFLLLLLRLLLLLCLLLFLVVLFLLLLCLLLLVVLLIFLGGRWCHLLFLTLTTTLLLSFPSASFSLYLKGSCQDYHQCQRRHPLS